MDDLYKNYVLNFRDEGSSSGDDDNNPPPQPPDTGN